MTTTPIETGTTHHMGARNLTSSVIEIAPMQKLLIALHAWIKQRPGLDYANYGDPKIYRTELRNIARDRRDAIVLLIAVEYSWITYPHLLDAFRAYSGRLSWDGERLTYCTGQYWPTEYRKAVCAVLAAALWDYYREEYSMQLRRNESAGAAIRRCFRNKFGCGVQRRWFN